MAPELFTETGALRPTEASDIYALSMTFLTIVTGRLPFSEYGSYFGRSSASHKGIHPPKPEEMIALTKNQADSLWVLLTSMWDDDPSARPQGMFVYDYLKRRLRSHRVNMPVDSTGTIKLNSRTRTTSVMAPLIPQQSPFANEAVPAKPPGNLHRAKSNFHSRFSRIRYIDVTYRPPQGVFCAIKTEARVFGRNFVTGPTKSLINMDSATNTVVIRPPAPHTHPRLCSWRNPRRIGAARFVHIV
jgi:serine/threonine protein kinase